MATRARIGFETQVGEIISSYHHWDGYPAGLGYNLITNWNDRDKLMEAVMLGDASSWGRVVGTKVDFNDREAAKTQNIYYGRDRGETGVGYKTHTDIDTFEQEYDYAGEEYAYVLRLDGTWTMFERYGEQRIEDAEDDIVLKRAHLIREYRKSQVPA